MSKFIVSKNLLNEFAHGESNLLTEYNPSALLLSARNPIQDVGLIYQAMIPQLGWYFTL